MIRERHLAKDREVDGGQRFASTLFTHPDFINQDGIKVLSRGTEADFGG